MMKLNIAVVFIPLLITAFVRLLLNKQYKNFLWNVCGYLLGLLIVLLPFYVYFLSTRSLNDFYSGYIAFNRLYADIHFSFRTIYILVRTILIVIYRNYVMSIMISAGLVVCIFSGKYFDRLEKISLLLSFALLLCMLYASGAHWRYNYIPSTVYVVFGIIFFLDFILPSVLIWIKTPYIFVLLCFIIPVNANMQSSRLFSPEPAVVRFARIVSREENPTLINYHTLDLGVQNIAGLLPNNKYFYVPNISYDVFPEVFDEQDAIINNRAVMFVVCNMDNLDTNAVELLLRNYTVVDSSEGMDTLLKRKP
jgi:hypothetical protein